MIQDKGKIKLTNWEIVSVNPNDKLWDLKDLFCFWGVSIQSIIGFSLITSLYLAYDLNFLIVLISCILGSFLVYIFATLIGKPSQLHGIPFPVFLRISMGVNGARYVSLFRGIVGIFMFGIQTYFLSKSIGYLIRISLHVLDSTFLDQDLFLIFFLQMNIIDWFSLIIAIAFQFFLFTKGHSFNKFLINFSAIFIYLGLILFLSIIVSEYSNDLFNSFENILVYENIFYKENLIPILTITGTIFAYFSILIVNFGDFSRYVKNNKELNKGNLSLLINLIIFSIFSVLIVLGADIILEKNSIDVERILTNPTDIIGKFDNISLSVVVLFFILFASASTNLIANYVPTQNTLLNFLPNKLNLKSSGIIIALLAFIIAAFWQSLLSQIGILSFIDTAASLFGPIFGIVIIDYYFLKNGKIVNKDIFSSLRDSTYYYSGGWHIKAIYALFIGFVFSSSTIWNMNLSFLQSYSWFVGALISSVVYYLLANR